jgi:protein gp37
MGDLFHGRVTNQDIEKIFQVMLTYPCRKRHTFILLTKRAERMRDFVRANYPGLAQCAPHIWLGVTAENQERAAERIPVLLQIPAVVHFVSVEPMLGPVDMDRILLTDPDGNNLHGMDVLDVIRWVICGAETGPRKRSMDPAWAVALRDQCIEADVPFFFKRDSDGGRLLDGQKWEQFP